MPERRLAADWCVADGRRRNLTPPAFIGIGRAATAMVLVAGITACGGTPSAQQHDSTSSPHPSSTTTSARPARSAPGVTAALRAIDPCSLFTASALAAAGLAASSMPPSPHTCQDPAQATDQDAHVVIDLGTNYRSLANAHQLKQITVGGALAEITDSTSLPGFSAACTVYLPVDLATDQAIDIDASAAANSSTDPCSTARTIAAGAVTQLGQATVAGTLPLAGWDACSALGAALGTTTGLVTVTSLDYCLDVNSPTQPDLTFTYDRPPGPTGDTFNATAITVGSRQGWAEPIAAVGNGPNSCSVAWSDGPSGQSAPHTDVVIDDTDQTCAQAAKEGAALQQVLAHPAPTGPQPPALLYPASS